jgi:phosphopantothenoylcysteine decarboxylase/phosphopantothenate--cysteine ligase
METVLDELNARPYRAAIFTAAVADYRPRQVLPGKTPSGGALQSLQLEPTPKVIRAVRKAHPDLYMITFKYEEGISRDEFLAIARARRAEGYEVVVANSGDERGPKGEHVAYLVSGVEPPPRLQTKAAIARAIADHLEQALAPASA